MKNQFFQFASKQAIRMAGKPAQLVALAVQATKWLTSGKATRQLKDARQDAKNMTRMISAYAKGSYRPVPKRAILSITAALIYFINPFDLIPDALIGFGLTDDLAVLTWVYQRVHSDVQLFLDWENSLFTPSQPGHPSVSS